MIRKAEEDSSMGHIELAAGTRILKPYEKLALLDSSQQIDILMSRRRHTFLQFWGVHAACVEVNELDGIPMGNDPRNVSVEFNAVQSNLQTWCRGVMESHRADVSRCTWFLLRAE